MTEPPSIVSRLRSGIALNIVGNVFNQGSTFGLNLIAANLLGRYAFGKFSTVQTTLSTVAALGQLGIGFTVTKHVAEFRDHDPEKAGRILRLCAIVSTITGLLAAGALYAGAAPIADRVFGIPVLTRSLRIAAVAVLFVVMNGYRTGALAGLEGYPALARAGVISGIIYLLVGALGALAGGVDGALAGVALSAAAQWTILGTFLRAELARHRLPNTSDVWGERSTLMRFALPASLTGFITLPALWFASALLIAQPGGVDQMALFGAANSFRVVVLFLPSAMTSVGTSLLNNQRRAGDKTYQRVFWWNLTLTAGCAVAAAVPIVALGPWLFRAFGRDFAPAASALEVLMIAAVLEAVAVATYQVIQTHGRIWTTLFLISLPRDGLIVALAYFLTPVYGATGLATAYAAGWGLALLVIVVLTYRLGLRASSEFDRATTAIVVPGQSGPV